MRAFAFAAGLFAVAAIATPLPAEPCDEDAPPCMTYEQALTVAKNFRSSIVAYSNETAIEHFTVDFTDYSSSVNTLIDSGCTTPQPLNDATFSSREQFMAGQGGQPAIPFKILNVWHTCDTVVFRWRSHGPGQEPEPVTGIDVAEVQYVPGNTANPFKIKTVYAEFNSGAWLVNLGVFTPNCTSS